MTFRNSDEVLVFHSSLLQKEERRLSSCSPVTLSPRGERTTPTLLQPRQPVLRESKHDADVDADGNDENEDGDDAGNDEYMQIIQSLAMHHRALLIYT